MITNLAAIIYDLDGTLLDTLRDIAETANVVLQQHGFPTHPLEAYATFVGDGLGVLMERILPVNHSAQLREQCCQRFLEVYEHWWDRHSRPYDGVGAMLARLSAAHLPLTVLSNKPHAFTVRMVERFFPEGPFSLVYGQRQGIARKPDPWAALDIARRLHANPAEMLFVGDTPIDIRTGKAAGMKTAGVTWGFRSARELLAERPDFLINHPSELKEHVRHSS